MIERILPLSVAAAESFECGHTDTLFPVVGDVIASGEFSATRACAQEALEHFVIPAPSFSAGRRDAPRWPPGMTGSFTHCAGYRAAVVALTSDFVLLGVDAEPNEALPDPSMLDLIARAGEREQLEILTASISGVSWDRLLLSTKLSVYKSWFPRTSWWLNFDLADIAIDAHEGTFIAELLAPGPIVDGRPTTEMHGRWLARQGFLVTTVLVPAA